jgi:carboxypeptidase Taq
VIFLLKEINMQQKLAELKHSLGQVMDLEKVLGVLGWDQQTYMPPGGAEDRGYHMATIGSLMHKMFTTDEVGKLLEELKPYAEQFDPDSDDARLIRVTSQKYHKKVRVPYEWVGEFAQVTTLAHRDWEQARADNDFEKFRPSLERIVELRRRFASFFAPYEHVYDPLLDEFEPGLKTAQVKSIFETLRPQQVELVQAINERPQVDDSFLHQHFDPQTQWDFGVEAITKMGYDWKHGRQDKAAHPFTTHFGIGDVRITTRIMPDYLGSAFFSTAHECGHALYEMGVDPKLARTPLAEGASMALHESQSRLWENLVGRSYPFWEHFYPRLQELFPTQMGNVSLEKFYKGINKVKPSLIRVEADEATYNLHIMLRLELEIALMEGSLEVRDLPEAWNARMRDYLGLTPPNNAMGVLQDVHWSSGYIGYFPTYALGNLVSLQLWEVIKRDIPELDDQIRQGQFGNLLGWLRENIHRHGQKFEPQELVQRVSGSKIDSAPYMRYLTEKYSHIYQL